MTDWSTWGYMGVAIQIDTFYISFYNKTLGVNYPIIKLSYTHTTLDLKYYDYTGNTQTIDSNFEEWDWKQIGWSINNNDGDVTYIGDGNITDGTAIGSVYIGQGYRIDSIYQTGTGVVLCRYDDWNWTLSSSYEGGGGGGISENYCGHDVSLYAAQIGDLYGVTNFGEIDATKISSNYGVSIDTTIRGIGLSVALEQYNEDNNANNYTLSINNQSIGGAECFTSFYNAYGSFYILYWDVNIRIYNQSLTFIYEHNKQSNFGWYWFIGQSTSSTDLDQDGDSIFYYDTSFTQCHWIYLNGFIPFWQCYDITITSRNADLGMTFWCDSIPSPPPVIPYNDTLGLSNWKYKNDTGYIYLIPDVSTEGIVCSYTLESQIDDYDIWINFTGWENGEYGWQYPYYIGDFPVNSIPYPDGVYSMIPNIEGRYDFCLRRNNAFCGVNITAWVVGNWINETYYIYTNPPISNQFDSYDVVYKYNNPNGYFGAVAKFDELIQFSSHGYYGKVDGWDIENNITETKTVSSYSSLAEYWGLFANKTNGFVLVFPMHTHKIRLFSVIENKIWVLPNPLTITNNNPENRGVVIYYTHRFIGTDISVYIDDIFYRNVGDSGSSSVSYTPRTAGYHTVKLKLNQNESLITVAENTFSVSLSGGGGGGDGGDINFPINVPTPYSYFAGIFVILLFTLSPLIFVTFLSKSSGRDFNISSIPQFVYMILAIIGFIVTIVIGWFPVWTVAVLIVMTIVIVVIMWLQKKNVSME